MLRFTLVTLLTIPAVRSAAADCTYHGSYTEPQNWHGVCVVTTQVPEGCPIYLVMPEGGTPLPLIVRDGQPIELPATLTVETTVEDEVSAIDVLDCSCPPISVAQRFDQIAYALDGARAGDAVGFANAGNADDMYVAITAPGACPAPAWPTRFHQFTACDLCPGDPPGMDPGPDGDGGGCATTGAGGGFAAGALALLLRRRRRVP